MARKQREPLRITGHTNSNGEQIDPIQKKDLVYLCGAVDKTIKTGQVYEVKPA